MSNESELQTTEIRSDRIEPTDAQDTQIWVLYPAVSSRHERDDPGLAGLLCALSTAALQGKKSRSSGVGAALYVPPGGSSSSASRVAGHLAQALWMAEYETDAEAREDDAERSIRASR